MPQRPGLSRLMRHLVALDGGRTCPGAPGAEEYPVRLVTAGMVGERRVGFRESAPKRRGENDLESSASIDIAKHTLLSCAMGAIITFGILAVAMGTGEFSLASSLLDLLRQSVLGIAAGAVLGYLAALLIAHQRWAFLAEYAPVVTLVAVIGAYFAADGMQASGFMAVFVFGIVLGNRDSFGCSMEAGEAQKLEEYVATTAFIMRLFIFILLGAQVDFGLMKQYGWGGIAVVAVLMLVARPATVFLCALPDRHAKWTFNEMLFMCWTRETGVIPAALAGLLLGMKAPGAQMIASVTFIAILMTILIQAPTTRWLAGRLGLLAEGGSGN
jgi:cell volume regulation protein A